MKFSIRNKILSKWGKVLLAVIIFVFIGKFIIDHIDELNISDYRLNIGLLVLSFAITVIHVFSISMIWYYLTIKSNCSISFHKTIAARVYSEFGKYVPGRVVGLGMLLYFYNCEYRSKKVVSSYLLLEYVATILGAIYVFLATILLSDNIGLEGFRLFSILVGLILAIIIHPSVLQFILNRVLILFRRDPLVIEVTFLTVIKIVILNAINWLVLSLSMFLLINAFYHVPINDIHYIVAAFTLASFFGLIAVFTPVGLGVRESILLIVLLEIMPKSLSGLFAIASRIWLLLAEIFLLVVVFIINKIKPIKTISE